MLNAERFKEKILDVVEDDKKYDFAIKDDDPNAFYNCHSDIPCKNCVFTSLKNGKNCLYNRFNWLLSEYKEPVNLSKVEYEILRYLYKRDYRYITREKSERVIAFKGRPHKRDYDIWNTISGEKIGYLDLYDFSNLFQFTNWEDSEPTLIQGVLNNCEVVESDL